MIHPSAIVSPSAKLGKDVEIEAFSIIGDNVEIGNNTKVLHHSIIAENTTLGKNCKIYPFSSIGTDPQDVTFGEEKTFLEIGNNNIFREFVTINRGTEKGGSYTRLGNNNYLMAYVHVGHDCHIGSNTVLINGTTLAGHVIVEDFVVISAFTSIHQFARIGRNAYIGGYTIVLQDVLPFAKITQARNTYSLYGPNSIGMMRNGISREFINNIKEMFNIIYKSNLNTTQALEKLEKDYKGSKEAAILIEFISKTKRGILKNVNSKNSVKNT